jgi:hypothetical protein
MNDYPINFLTIFHWGRQTVFNQGPREAEALGLMHVIVTLGLDLALAPTYSAPTPT